METLTRSNKIIIRSRVTLPEIVPEEKKTLSSGLRQYLNKEDKSETRFKWVAISMVLQAVIITPIVGIVIINTGNALFLWGLCAAAMYLTFVPSIAGLRVKSVLSTFLISVAINITIVLFAIGMHIF